MARTAVFLAASLIVVVPSPCFALWLIAPVSNERAIEMDMEVRSTAAAPITSRWSPTDDCRGHGQVPAALDRRCLVGQGRGHVVDYGRIEVASEDLGVEQAVLIALREFRDLATEGWEVEGRRTVEQPDLTLIDAGYMTSVVYAFSREAGDKFKPAIGRGAAQQRHQWYNRPTQTGSVVRHIGEGYHVNYLRSEKLRLVEIDADHWKTWVHQRLVSPLDSDGAMTLFQAPPQEHLALAKHLTAEVKTEEFVAGKGVVVKWERLRRQNHWFDALYNACAAGHYCGVRLVGGKREPRPRMTLEELRRNAMGRPTARELAAGAAGR